jgi:hypothetical protein
MTDPSRFQPRWGVDRFGAVAAWNNSNVPIQPPLARPVPLPPPVSESFHARSAALLERKQVTTADLEIRDVRWFAAKDQHTSALDRMLASAWEFLEPMVVE